MSGLFLIVSDAVISSIAIVVGDACSLTSIPCSEDSVLRISDRAKVIGFVQKCLYSLKCGRGICRRYAVSNKFILLLPQLVFSKSSFTVSVFDVFNCRDARAVRFFIRLQSEVVHCHEIFSFKSANRRFKEQRDWHQF